MKKRILSICIAVMCLIMVPAYAGCSGGNDEIIRTLQRQLDEMQAQIDQLANTDAQTQNELNALKARVAILEGKVLNPREYYAMGETITYESNGFKLFDFVLLDAYKTTSLSTTITYQFTSYPDFIRSGYLSDFIKFATKGTGSSNFLISSDQHKFSKEPQTFTTSIIGVGTTIFALWFPIGENYIPLAKIKFDLQMRVE